MVLASAIGRRDEKKSPFWAPDSICASSAFILMPEAVQHPRLELLREVDYKKQQESTRSARKFSS
jgi:hypothetical protein